MYGFPPLPAAEPAAQLGVHHPLIGLAGGARSGTPEAPPRTPAVGPDRLPNLPTRWPKRVLV